MGKQKVDLLAEQELPAEPLPIPNLEDPLEASDNDIKMVRFNLAQGCITHTIFLGAMPPLFGTTLRPGFPAAFATFCNTIRCVCWHRKLQAYSMQLQAYSMQL
ncbi:uncharacterized protein LOC133849009 [Drosophila sulfurigaster albostrigata]|uniref:uncharacterized protein LOC133849009 n=1 Tax=Drosophila sulfurigaster albostrigata TaxID=89887 RepID=UPI002D219BA9|nr:uncharacterized protein LOC133849009 [Drosophila sulfurigaster albostrigata]